MYNGNIAQELRKEQANESVDQMTEEKELARKKLEEAKNNIAIALSSYALLAASETEKFEKFKMDDNILFTNGEDGVKRIDPRFLDNLKVIDLSSTNFDDADVHGIDFTDCNPVLLNPQTVWNNDMSGTTFVLDSSRLNNTFPFGSETNFYGVNLRGAKIIAEDLVYLNLYGAEMDEETLVSIQGEVISNAETKVM